jgi:hypothetical protein
LVPEVVEHTKMDLDNISMIFAPSIFKPIGLCMTDLVASMSLQAQFMANLLRLMRFVPWGQEDDENYCDNSNTTVKNDANSNPNTNTNSNTKSDNSSHGNHSGLSLSNSGVGRSTDSVLFDESKSLIDAVNDLLDEEIKELEQENQEESELELRRKREEEERRRKARKEVIERKMEQWREQRAKIAQDIRGRRRASLEGDPVPSSSPSSPMGVNVPPKSNSSCGVSSILQASANNRNNASVNPKLVIASQGNQSDNVDNIRGRSVVAEEKAKEALRRQLAQRQKDSGAPLLTSSSPVETRRADLAALASQQGSVARLRTILDSHSNPRLAEAAVMRSKSDDARREMRIERNNSDRPGTFFISSPNLKNTFKGNQGVNEHPLGPKDLKGYQRPHSDHKGEVGTAMDPAAFKMTPLVMPPPKQRREISTTNGPLPRSKPRSSTEKAASVSFRPASPSSIRAKGLSQSSSGSPVAPPRGIGHQRRISEGGVPLAAREAGTASQPSALIFRPGRSPTMSSVGSGPALLGHARSNAAAFDDSAMIGRRSSPTDAKRSVLANHSRSDSSVRPTAKSRSHPLSLTTSSNADAAPRIRSNTIASPSSAPSLSTPPIAIDNASRICAGCQQQIEGGRCLSALGRHYHREHFVCLACGQQLGTTQFIVVGGKPMCQPCHSARASSSSSTQSSTRPLSPSDGTTPAPTHNALGRSVSGRDTKSHYALQQQQQSSQRHLVNDRGPPKSYSYGDAGPSNGVRAGSAGTATSAGESASLTCCKCSSPLGKRAYLFVAGKPICPSCYAGRIPAAQAASATSN